MNNLRYCNSDLDTISHKSKKNKKAYNLEDILVNNANNENSSQKSISVAHDTGFIKQINTISTDSSMSKEIKILYGSFFLQFIILTLILSLVSYSTVQNFDQFVTIINRLGKVSELFFPVGQQIVINSEFIFDNEFSKI